MFEEKEYDSADLPQGTLQSAVSLLLQLLAAYYARGLQFPSHASSPSELMTNVYVPLLLAVHRLVLCPMLQHLYKVHRIE